MQALARSEIEYFIIASKPPAAPRKDGVFIYQIKVLSKNGGLKYHLDSGPKGMTVSSTGEVKWRVPEGWSEKSTGVIISIRDSGGAERLHAFTLGME